MSTIELLLIIPVIATLIAAFIYLTIHKPESSVAEESPLLLKTFSIDEFYRQHIEAYSNNQHIEHQTIMQSLEESLELQECKCSRSDQLYV
jgi:hypothetical protein